MVTDTLVGRLLATRARSQTAGDTDSTQTAGDTAVAEHRVDSAEVTDIEATHTDTEGLRYDSTEVQDRMRRDIRALRGIYGQLALFQFPTQQQDISWASAQR